MDRPDPGNRRQPDPVLLADGGAGTGTGGTVVGLTTRDGVVLTADTRTSSDTVVSSADVRKIAQVHPTAAVGSTADLGTARSVVETARSEVDRHETRRGEPMDVSALATFVAGELRSRSGPAVAFVLGGVDDRGPHVFTLGPEGAALEDEYAAVGSGGDLAYGVLDAEETDSLTMAEGRRIAGRAVESATRRDVRTGVGVQVAEITAAGVDVRRYESVEDVP